ncbi:hypothetical protein BO95DRAFT_351052, partial [Aspergillus brunneoviolaceus CBS 621.78]
LVQAHTTTGCGKQGFPSAQPYLSHTPGANPFCCMFLVVFHHQPPALSRDAELSSIYLYDCCISNAAWVKETIILHIGCRVCLEAGKGNPGHNSWQHRPSWSIT